MKKIIIAWGIVSLLALASCGQEIATNNQTNWKNINDNLVETNVENTIEVTWVVSEVMNWKDWYTAKLMNENQEEYFATMSVSNLWENSDKYAVYEEWDEITVIGELWNLGEEKHITVKDIK